jgi:hypothetical protein
MNAPKEEFEEYLEATKEKQAQQREGKRRTLYKFIYVVLFIAFFPILWYSFLLTAFHQIVSLFVLFLNIEYRKKEINAGQGKFTLASIFLIVFHLILITASILIYFFAKENPQTGNYYF